MKRSILQQQGISPDMVALLGRLVERVPWPERRIAMGDVVATLLAGRPRTAEAVFGWARATVTLGLNERRTNTRCLNDLAARRKPKAEEKLPQLLTDIHALLAPHSHADPQLRTTLAYTKVSAAAVRVALLATGWTDDQLPGVRTFNNILNRNGYRLRTVAKTKAQKKRR